MNIYQMHLFGYICEPQTNPAQMSICWLPVQHLPVHSVCAFWDEFALNFLRVENVYQKG